MSEREARIRAVIISYFPMFIATLSLVTSIYNGYLNNKFVDPAGVDRLFEPADRIFGEMNDDCVRSAKAALR